MPTETPNYVFLIDAAGRRLYHVYTRPFDAPDANSTYIREYDLASRIPIFLREGRLATSQEISPVGESFSSNRATIDRKRDRILLVSFSGGPLGCEGDPRCGGTVGAIGRIFVVDRKTLRVTDVWAVSDRLPGFLPLGITYSPDDDRIYLIGETGTVQSPSALLTGANPRTFPTTILALEPENGNVAWVRLVPECGVALYASELGVTVVRSRLRPFLYFACIRTSTSPETAGIMRLWIDPKADSRDALGFPLEAFPISGSYTSGEGIVGSASFDPGTDRFFMTSLSLVQPGAWVFDGRLSAWVGFVAAPVNNNRYAAVDELSGRYYMAGKPGQDPSRGKLPGYVLVVEGRQTPVPQGEAFVLGDNGAVDRPMYVDPLTRRLFVAGKGQNNAIEWLVYQDTTPLPDPPTEIDYDDLTTGLEESPNTLTTFAGTVNGFGSRVLLTGGTSGLTGVDKEATIMTPVNAADTAARLAIDVLFSQIFEYQPSRADRGVFGARVTSLDLRNVGASAGAQALSLDPISDGEYETALRTTANRARNPEEIRDEEREREGGRPDDNDEIGDQIERQLAWPHREAFCLDGSGDPGTDEESTGEGGSDVTCDLKAQTARASTTFRAFSIEGVSIGYSSFTSQVLRDPKLGTVTRSEALVRDVELTSPGGTVTIGRVVASATTQARGRTKTAKANWERRLEGVVVRSQNGAELYECGEAESCDVRPAVEAMNQVLAARMRVSSPDPLITASNGGAFAAIEESDGDFLNGLNANNDSLRAVPALTITLYNDWTEKSRLAVQLAAIQASSIYGITPLPGSEFGGGDLPIPLPLPPIGESPLPPAPILDGVLPPETPPVGRLVETPLFLIRSPKQAFLFGLTMLLFAGAAAAIWRRRTLLRELNV